MGNGQGSKQKILKITYQVISEIGNNAYLGEFNTYGIQLLAHDCEEVIHDVSVDKQTVDQMAELFNVHQLSPCHFKDLVEDMLF